MCTFLALQSLNPMAIKKISSIFDLQLIYFQIFFEAINFLGCQNVFQGLCVSKCLTLIRLFQELGGSLSLD